MPLRPLPILLGCALMAFGLLYLFGDHLMGASAGQTSIVDGLVGFPGLMLGGGLALLFFGFTEKKER